LRPWELDSLTFTEIAIYLEKPDDVGPDGGPAVPSDQELAEYAQWWASLTLRERLEQAR
jgi:hypothetical protein